jgi:ribosome assembly protein 1
MLYPDLYEATVDPKNKLEEDLFASKSGPDACVTAYVSKMFAVSVKDLPENKKKPITAEEMRAKAREARAAREAAATSEEVVDPVSTTITDYAPIVTTETAELKEDAVEDAEIILGFARLYSGTIRMGTTMYGVLPKYKATMKPTHPRNAKYLVTATVEGLYVMMGRELVAVDSVSAGNIFAIKGLEGKVWRSATLCAPGELGIQPDSDGDLRAFLINLGGVHRAVC